MSNNWNNITDQLPPFDKPYLAYMPTAREANRFAVAVDSKVMSANPMKEYSRMTIVGGLFAWDLPPIEKWILLEDIVSNPEGL